MTKRRLPVTFENALTRLAGTIGWAEVARICGAAERTVRNWSDPDTSAAITLDAALALDLAWRGEGGEGAPMFQCYRLRLEADAVDCFAAGDQLALAAARTAKESGEAIESAIIASRPGATEADRHAAEKELEEAISAATTTLATLRAGRRGGRGGQEEAAHG